MQPDEIFAAFFGDEGTADGVPGVQATFGAPGVIFEAVIIISVNDGELVFSQRYQANIVAETAAIIKEIRCAY